VPALIDEHAVSASENWTYRWDGLLSTDEEANAYAYFIREVDVTGFDTSYANAQTAQTADGKTVYRAVHPSPADRRNRRREPHGARRNIDSPCGYAVCDISHAGEKEARERRKSLTEIDFTSRVKDPGSPTNAPSKKG
jgi:predicted RNA-binding Zn ribbon-like protein